MQCKREEKQSAESKGKGRIYQEPKKIRLNLEIRKSFEKDVAKLPVSVKLLIEKAIREIMSKDKLSELSSCKKLSGYKSYYRIRLGSYLKTTQLTQLN